MFTGLSYRRELVTLGNTISVVHEVKVRLPVHTVGLSHGSQYIQ